MEMLRDFMPGECSLGSAAEAFEAVDKAEQTTPAVEQKIAIAKLACQSCEQLLKCQEQQDGIQEVLSARAKGAQFVIGGEVIERVEPPEPDPVLNEPAFQFDLACVPNDPRQQLELIRQGFRSRQLRLGTPNAPRYLKQVTARLHEALTAKTDMDESNKQEIAATVAQFALRYRIAQNHALPTYKRSKAKLTEEELLSFEALQDLFVDDVQAVKAMGATQPIQVARLHQPAFYESLMKTYGDSFHITPGYIRSMCALVLDPLAKVKETITKNRHLKEQANRGELEKPDLAQLNAGGVYTARANQVRREKLVNFFRIPEASQYIQLLAKKDIPDHAAEVKKLLKQIRSLQASHPHIETIALAAIAYHHSDPEQAVATFEITFENLKQCYTEHEDLSNQQLQRFAFENIELEKAQAATEAYLARLETVRNVSSRAGIVITDTFARAYAFDHTADREIDEQTIAYKFKYYQLLRLKNLRSLQGWVREKIALMYEQDTFIKAAENLAIFLKRGYVKTVFSTEESTSVPRHIQSNKGQYITWNDEFLVFTEEEREAILYATHLDKLILGRQANEEELKKYFDTNNIRSYVDNKLLPCSFAEVLNLQSGASILALLRRSLKDHPKRTRLKKPQEALLDQAAQDVLAALKDEFIEAHDLDTKECMQNVRLLLMQIAFWSPSKLKNKQLVKSVVREYLAEVSRIQAHDLRGSYVIARGFSADFCDSFISLINPQKHFTKGRANELLLFPASQPVLELRKFQNVMRITKPLFEARRIKPGYCAHVSFEYRNTIQNVKDTLQEYDEVIETFGGNAMVNTATIHAFCFIQLKKNVIEEITDWLDAFTNLDPIYTEKLQLENIKQTARFKKGKALADELMDRIRTIDDIEAIYAADPHPAIDREVIEWATFRSTKPIKWLQNEYLARYNHVQQHTETSDIPLPILRRLLLLHAKDPLNAITIYRRICRDYENDSYIDQSTIDEAVKWDLTRAASTLVKTRRKRAKNAIAMHKPVGESHGSSFHDIIGDTKAVSPESVIDKIANQQILANLAHGLAAIERAVLAAVFELPWLAPRELCDEDGVDVWRVMQHYRVSHFDDLEVIAYEIISNLKPR